MTINSYFLVVIFLPLINLVDVDVLLILAGPPALVKLVKDAKPLPFPWCPPDADMKSFIPPKPKPNGVINDDMACEG